MESESQLSLLDHQLSNYSYIVIKLSLYIFIVPHIKIQKFNIKEDSKIRHKRSIIEILRRQKKNL